MSDETAMENKPKLFAVNESMFQMPKFDIPKFDVPNMEVPPAFREFAEKGIAQAKEGYEKIKANAEKTTETLEETYAIAAKGCTDYNLKLIETARANSNAAFDLMGELMGAKSYSQVLELTTAFMRNRFDALTAQTKELTAQAQKVATESAEPMKETFAKINQAA
ncbi:MAG: phasin [Pseudolabrys sp.]|nr:phasin [Pseudolabrys sp.]